MGTSASPETHVAGADSAAMWLAIGASIVTGSAHLGLKWTADNLSRAGSFTLEVATWLGLFCGMQATALLLYTLALRRGALSTIYPVLSLRYFWVIGLGALLFPTDSLNVYKIAGVGLVVLGVMAVARGGMGE